MVDSGECLRSPVGAVGVSWREVWGSVLEKVPLRALEGG
jgi:hypothetical protein